MVPLAIGSAISHVDYGAFAALGALPAGLASFQGFARSRMAAVALATVGMSVSTFAGATTAATDPWMLVAAVLLWGYVIGLAVCLGPRVSVATLQWGAALLIAVGMPLAPGPAGIRAGLVLAGGLLQGLLVAASWVVRTGDAERKAIAGSCLALSAYARGVAAGSVDPPPAVALPAAAILEDPNPLLREGTQLTFLDLLEEAERVRASLAALAAQAADMSPDCAARLRRLSIDAAELLDLVAANLSARRRERTERARELTRRAAALAVPVDAAARPTIEALFGQLRAVARIVVYLAEPAAKTTSTTTRLARPSTQDGAVAVATLRANAHLSSEAGRHALRLGVTAALAEVMVVATGLREGRWVVLTLFIVLRPDYGSTVFRSTQRAVGTALGVGLGAAATQVAHLGRSELVAIAGVTVAAAFAFVDVAYVLFAAFLSTFVVVLLDILGSPAVPTATARLADTAIGAALALIAYFVWPTWEAVSAEEKFALLLEAHGEYATSLLRQLAHPGRFDASRLRTLQAAARRTRGDAEASTARLSEEPPHAPLTPQLARALIAAVRRLTQAELAVHALATLQQVPAGRAHQIVGSDRPALLDRLASALGTTMSTLAQSLRTMEPPAPAPDLRQLQAELTIHAPVANRALATATDRLVDVIDTLNTTLRDHLELFGPARVQVHRA
jgi:uncharacterized membrane protein YccC